MYATTNLTPLALFQSVLHIAKGVLPVTSAYSQVANSIFFVNHRKLNASSSSIILLHLMMLLLHKHTYINTYLLGIADEVDTVKLLILQCFLIHICNLLFSALLPVFFFHFFANFLFSLPLLLPIFHFADFLCHLLGCRQCVVFTFMLS